MAHHSGPRNDWPTDDEFKKVIFEEKGNVSATVRRFKWPSDPSFRTWVQRSPARVKMVSDAKEAARAAATAAPAASPAPTPGEVSREHILEAKVKEQEAELRKHRQGSVLDAAALERFSEAFGRVKPQYSPLVIAKSQRSKEKHEHVLLFSDTHANEVVSEEETMGLNAYSWDIMLKRMERIRHSVLSFQENRPYPIQRLHIPMLGDMLSGDIHDELTITNEKPNEEAVVQFALDTAEWLQEFAPHYESIHLSGVPGNHPRKTKKPMAKMAFNNSDWTYYQFLKARLEGQANFTFNFQKAKFAELMVGDGRWRMLALHGDGIRSTMVDVPWGGIIRYLGKLARTYATAGKPVDFFALGHWHTANAIEAGGPDTKTFVNGSLKGVDEYSLQRFGGGSAPSQILLTVHPRRGITDVSYLDGEDRIPQSERLAQAA